MEVFVVLTELYQWLKVSLSILPSEIRNTVQVVIIVVPVSVSILIIERIHDTRTRVYRTANFAHDLIYFFYYESGLGSAITIGLILQFFGPQLQMFEVELLDNLPFLWQVILWFVIADFVLYWSHRMVHSIGILWAFHSTHHAQQHLNFATGGRIHPVDHFVRNLIYVIPFVVLGMNPVTWLPVYLMAEIILICQHTRIPWKLGPLYRVFVTPHFHSFHHSLDPMYYNRNYGSLLSVWDHLFGTAVTADNPITETGLADIKNPTFLSSLYMPFLILYRQYAAHHGNQATGQG